MSGVELRPIDKQGPPIHLPVGKTTVGRGPFLGCTDKRISRSHAVLEVTAEGEVTLTPIHTNPCFKINGNTDLKPFTKDVAHSLHHGDRFSMLPSAFEYEVVIACKKKNGQENNIRTDSDQITKKGADKSRVNHVDKADLSQASSATAPTIGKMPSLSEDKTLTNRVEIAEKKASAFLDLDDGPSTSSNASSRKRVLPSWLIEAAEQQCSAKQEKTPPKRTPVAKPKASRKEDSGDEKSKPKPPSSSKVVRNLPTPENKLNIPNKARDVKKANDKKSNYDMSDESDEDMPSASKTKPRPAPKNAKPNFEMSDEEDSDHSSGANKETKANSKKRRKPCMYGAKCYRKNPAHFKEFTHPGDDDYDSEPDGGGDRSRSPAGDDSDDSRPECEFGLGCYRKNPQHRKDYKHTAQRQPPRAAAKKAKVKVRRQNAGSDDEDGDSDDSFIDDDSDEYKPESGEDSDDPSLLLAEAEKFKRNQKLFKAV